MWILTAFPVIRIPMFVAEFHQWKHCGSFLKKHNFDEQVQLFDIYLRLFIRSHLAVGRHYRRRTPWCPHGRELSRVKVFVTDHMHTRTGINYKLSLSRLSWWGTWENQLLCRWEECSPVVLFELVYIVGKIPSLALGTSLLSSSLFVGPILEFWSVVTSLTRIDFCFSQRWSFLFPDTRLTLRELSESNFSNCVQDFLHRVSPKLFCSLRNECIRVLSYTTPLWYAFRDSHNAFVFTFSSFWEVAFVSAFCFVAHQFCYEETNTCLPPYNPFLFHRIGTRADANIHKEFACRYPSNNICTVVEQWIHGYLCLGCFSSPTHFYFVKGLARKVIRQCVLVFAHDLGLRGGNCNGLLANTGLFLSTGNRYLFLLQRQLIPCDSWPLLLIQFSYAWRQSFVNEVFD